ncbi:hypothetical protein K438DRAFT_1817283 [Mycena galopus ATCC 62051]|nr:hypothetical protein K438DRAFT_1817283 [Mycena galopus ATCC 62051]
MGWGEEPKELTDRIWKNIKDPLVEFLTQLKEKRLASDKVKIIKKRRLLAAELYGEFREASPPDVAHPSKIDVLLTEPFRVVIEDTPFDPEEIVTEESFAAAMASIPEFAAHWRRHKDDELVKIMQKVQPDSVEADLYLATTFFNSAGPYDHAEPLNYPTILAHSSATNFRYGTNGLNSLQDTCAEEAWNASGVVKFHERAQRNARFVVEACGLDPDVTTSAEMDEINPALECLNCSQESGRLVMRWVRATHHNCSVPSWKCLTADDERRLEVEERQAFETRMTGYRYLHGLWESDYCCKVCGHSRRMTLSKLKAHLETEHQISDLMAVDNFVYHISVGSTTRQLPPLRLKPPAQEQEVSAKVETAGAETVSEDKNAVGSEAERTA